MTYNNPNLYLVNVNAYIKFGEILSICSNDIEWKWNYDGRNDGIRVGRNDRQPKSNIAPLFQSGAIIIIAIFFKSSTPLKIIVKRWPKCL